MSSSGTQGTASEEQPQFVVKGHEDLRVHSGRGVSIVVECACEKWRRTVDGGHTLTELQRFLGQHQQAVYEELVAAKRRATLV